jgi:hypothetical protein
MRHMIALALGLVLLGSHSALGAATPEQKCEASKNKAAGAYASCLQATQAKAVLQGVAPDFTKCDERFAAAFAKAEEKAAKKGIACPSEDDAALLQSFVSAHSGEVSDALGGEPLPGCGNGAVDAAGEECDGPDLRGKDCTDFALVSGSLACDGSCQYDLGGCSACPGTEIGGFCWVLGGDNQSCDQACAGIGSIYDGEGTRGFAGSDGTNENCQAVLDTLGAPGSGPPTNPACADAFGCAVTISGTRARCLDPTTSTSAIGTVLRACACQ